MEAFASLLDRLYYTQSNLAKAALVRDYLARTSDPDRGFAVAALAGTLNFELFKRHVIREVVEAHVDAHLFALARDYVGEMSETVAHIWPQRQGVPRLNPLPRLSEVIARFSLASKAQIQDYLILLLDSATPEQRWALLKLGTGSMRVGISARFMKGVLAQYGGKDIAEIEALWHGLKPPYEELFAWLEGRQSSLAVEDAHAFHPLMLSHPLEDEATSITPEEFAAEWKYDGIRVQLVTRGGEARLYSRNGDDISAAFPDLSSGIKGDAVLDGELLVKHEGVISSFNDLQQRLNRKQPARKLIEMYPAHVVFYDILMSSTEDVRGLPFLARRHRLEAWLQAHPDRRFSLSGLLEFSSLDDLTELRSNADRSSGNYIEGLMLKRKTSPYTAGRPKGQWYKWKRDPLAVDAVLMYAQRGSGKRSSYYSDYTFGLWQDGMLLPIGKAYSGFTDEELRRLDHWIRNHTTSQYGPVREVEKALVFEVAFDAVHPSKRHKSGYALRFPRISRIRWDKPAAEADQLSALLPLLQQQPAGAS